DLSGAVQVFDVRTGAAVLSLNTQKVGRVESVVFHPNGKLLACGGEGKTGYPLEIASGAGRPAIQGQCQFCRASPFSPGRKAAPVLVRLSGPRPAPVGRGTNAAYHHAVGPRQYLCRDYV